MRKIVIGVLIVVLLHFCLSESSATSCIQKELEALLQLKKSFYDPSHRLASWTGTNCCTWDGIACDQITTPHLTHIHLRYNDQVYSSLDTRLYSNSIDSSLFEFKYLNYLDLSGNYFNYTQIPNFLGSMVELRYLNLSYAFFSRKIPPHLGNLTKLVFLDLSSYDCSGSDVEWISQLSSLHYLGLGGMNFSKTSNIMQILSSLPLLSSLTLSSCSLQNIHLSFGSLNSSFLSRIQLLDLSFNHFNGPLSNKVFQNMSSLRFLYLSSNKFTTIEGGLWSFIGNHCGLKVFDLSLNYDVGGNAFGSYGNVSMHCNRYDLQVLDLTYTLVKNKIPDWLGKFTNLQSLNLQGSDMYGPIPASLGNLSSLEYLDLSLNALIGAIPTSFGRLLNLKELYLRENRLEEVDDECFIQLGNLEVLDISKNSLKGVLTEASFANLSQLKALRFGYNELVLLDMKSDWVPPFQLKYLDGESCIGCFGSEFPHWLRTQKALDYLQLSNMNISSALPKWLIGQNLTFLDLSHNQIVGPLPTSITDQLPNLKELHLNDNLINDSLPPSLCKLKSLRYLDLSNNRLFGMVQGCLLTPNLNVLDLSSNKFSGTFPYSHGNDLSELEELYLGNNKFEGSMPIVLKNSKYLKILDLEGNKFSRNIPTWVGNNLENLRILRLRGNLFNGTIPSSLCNLTHLHILDLAHNQLEGSIPSNLSNFDAMIGKTMTYVEVSSYCFGRHGFYRWCNIATRNVGQFIKSGYFNYSLFQIELMVNIDLSKNYLVGFIPSEITMLKRLIGLNLSHNNLTGTIPTKMGAIESLESLDLSFNQLSGPVPRSISELNSLGVLDLSHNNLSGEIPREGHLSTFNEASSFDVNPYLCGDPLPVKCAIETPFEPPFKMENLDQEEDKWEKQLLYIMIMLGYVIGFWIVVGALILKRSWRYAYFKFVDDTKYKFQAIIWWNIDMLKGICTHKGVGKRKGNAT